jgi:Starch binding domain
LYVLLPRGGAPQPPNLFGFKTTLFVANPRPAFAIRSQHRRSTSSQHGPILRQRPYANPADVTCVSALDALMQAAFGDSIKLVGNLPKLGSWDVLAAPDLSWEEGHNWRVTLELPHGADLQFKLVRVTPTAWAWEEGEDRRFRVALEVRRG